MVVDDKQRLSGEVVEVGVEVEGEAEVAVGFEVGYEVGVQVEVEAEVGVEDEDEVGVELVGYEQYGFSKYAFPGSVPLRKTQSKSCIYGGW